MKPTILPPAGSLLPKLSNAVGGHRGSMKIRSVLLFILALTMGTGSLAAQSQNPQDQNTQQDRPFTQSYDRSSGNIYYDRTKAIPRNHSRAQEEADELVALSADKIISLLTLEPGLLLECKKLLVRTAFSQGRILDKDDLTDNAVFELVRADQKVRSLFTQELSDRYYIRAKPTKEELQQDWLVGLVAPPGPNNAPTNATAATNSVN